MPFGCEKGEEKAPFDRSYRTWKKGSNREAFCKQLRQYFKEVRKQVNEYRANGTSSVYGGYSRPAHAQKAQAAQMGKIVYGGYRRPAQEASVTGIVY